MSDKPWFHSTTSRQEADDLLYKAGLDGSFIVRPSGSIQGAYAISLLFKGSIHTYRALPTEDGTLSIQTLRGVQQRKFATIDELVEANEDAYGLVCGLTNPVSNDVPPPVPPFIKGKAYSPTNSEPPSNLVARANCNAPSLPTRIAPPLPNRDPNKSPKLPRPLSSQIKSAGKEKVLQNSLMSRFETMQLMGVPVSNSFKEEVRTYLAGKKIYDDISTVTTGGFQCAQLQSVIMNQAVTLKSELNVFLEKVQFLQTLYDLQTPLSQPNNDQQKRTNGELDLENILRSLADCGKVVQKLNTTAQQNIQKTLNLNVPINTLRHKTTKRKNYERTTAMFKKKRFNVKVEGTILKASSFNLELDMERGVLSIFKSDGSLFQTYDHTKILQIIKNTKGKSKLVCVFEDKKREFTFEENQQREIFCQLIQQIRNSHSKTSDPDQISVFCGSWNMGNALPPDDVNSWLLCSGQGKTLDPSLSTVPHDIYVIGVQESGLSEKELIRKIMESLNYLFTGSKFHLVVCDSLWQLRTVVIVKEEHKHRISHVKTSSVKTGIANTLGNKGAVGVSFYFGGSPFCFINSHLTSGAEKLQRRNNNYHDIIQQLALGSDETLKNYWFTNRFEHMFFFGDLNYRLNLKYEEIMQHLGNENLQYLLDHDQLKIEQQNLKAFNGFDEEEIQFHPTYRYERGTRERYAHLKVKTTTVKTNVPSWCDRVLRKSHSGCYYLSRAYGCTDDIMTSDHSPIFSSFSLGVKRQFVSKQGVNSETENAQIIFTRLELKSLFGEKFEKRNYILMFHSECLHKTEKTGVYKSVKITTNNHQIYSWEQIFKVQPIISDLEYLVDQHLYCALIIEGEENEYLGECIIPLRYSGENQPELFQEKMTWRGTHIGYIQGLISITSPSECRRKPKRRRLAKMNMLRGRAREKTYEFIQIGNFSKEENDKDSLRKLELKKGRLPAVPLPHISTHPSPTFPRSEPSYPRNSQLNAKPKAPPTYEEVDTKKVSPQKWKPPVMLNQTKNLKSMKKKNAVEFSPSELKNQKLKLKQVKKPRRNANPNWDGQTSL